MAELLGTLSSHLFAKEWRLGVLEACWAGDWGDAGGSMCSRILDSDPASYYPLVTHILQPATTEQHLHPPVPSNDSACGPWSL